MAARTPRVRAVGLAVAVVLGASVPGCLLPELIVDGTGSGGGGSDLGGAGSGGAATDSGGAGTDSGGAATDSGGAGGSGGAPNTGGDGAGGDGSGGAGSGGTSSGGAGTGGATIGGYYESGDWHGFVGTAADLGTIDPTAFDDVANPPYCMSGSVNADDEFLGFAGWTWNLNQDPDCTPAGCVPAVEPVALTTDGVQVQIDNEFDTALRIQIQGMSGTTWCAALPATTGTMFVSWALFETSCWNGTGTQYGGESVESLQIVVPGPGPAGQPAEMFDFCVQSVSPANTPATGCSLSDGPGDGTYTLGGVQNTQVDRESLPYIVHSNVWSEDDGSQSITGEGTAFEIVQQTATRSTAYGPFSYPSVFIGDQYGLTSGTANLPATIATISSLPTVWSWSQPSGGDYLALYELWFNNPGSETPSAYIQIILGGEVTPIGTYQGNFAIGPNTWELWTGMLQGQPISTYRHAGAVFTEFEFDLVPFLSDAVTRGLSASLELTMVAAGFQVWSGSVGASSNNFCAMVQ